MGRYFSTQGSASFCSKSPRVIVVLLFMRTMQDNLNSPSTSIVLKFQNNNCYYLLSNQDWFLERSIPAIIYICIQQTLHTHPLTPPQQNIPPSCTATSESPACPSEYSCAPSFQSANPARSSNSTSHPSLLPPHHNTRRTFSLSFDRIRFGIAAKTKKSFPGTLRPPLLLTIKSRDSFRFVPNETERTCLGRTKIGRNNGMTINLGHMAKKVPTRILGHSVQKRVPRVFIVFQ